MLVKKEDLDSLKKRIRKAEDKLKMIEMKFRNYKELNGNPFTLIRDINEIIYPNSKFDR